MGLRLAGEAGSPSRSTRLAFGHQLGTTLPFDVGLGESYFGDAEEGEASQLVQPR